jgi:hypothetical protein
MSQMQSATLGVEMADTILFPIAIFNLLAGMPFNATAEITVLEWFKRYNIYTMTTGLPVTVRVVRGLEVAGTSTLNRMVFYRNDPQVLKLHMPMPHRFLPVWQRAPLAFDVPGIFRTGGVEVRRPTAMRYLDGV